MIWVVGKDRHNGQNTVDVCLVNKYTLGTTASEYIHVFEPPTDSQKGSTVTTVNHTVKTVLASTTFDPANYGHQ